MQVKSGQRPTGHSTELHRFLGQYTTSVPGNSRNRFPLCQTEALGEDLSLNRAVPLALLSITNWRQNDQTFLSGLLECCLKPMKLLNEDFFLLTISSYLFSYLLRVCVCVSVPCVHVESDNNFWGVNSRLPHCVP